ncbi:MAG: aminoacetone oxidase family FAD-binding enzyme [Lentisphaeria bacterium]|nr:aminoacetone oxidase family FAD-binding enzyme [Lentisphaeria bacterium]
MTTDLVIIGGGAAGLMAGVTAAEAGLRGVILERRHRVGLKMLLCGNNRCNVTHRDGVAAMLTAYGEPVATFLRPALTRFPPAALEAWFRSVGLATMAQEDGRVFPRSGKADDVVHVFTDRLRDLGMPLVLNCPVTAVERQPDGGFLVTCPKLVLRGPRVLIATGGVSYPKTGSVGDGQVFAKALGHRIEPYRPGLAGIELGIPWLEGPVDVRFPDTRVRVLASGEIRGETRGEILCGAACARGPAMLDASRLIARGVLRDVVFLIDLFPASTVEVLSQRLRAELRRCHGDWPRALTGAGLPGSVAREFFIEVLQPAAGGDGSVRVAADVLKGWRIRPRRVRPLKEAMVTVGGVSLEDVDPVSMQSRRCPGLCFAGEVLDVDGPTGGYNLHAAFATARLAVVSLAPASVGGPASTVGSPARRRSRFRG